MILLLWYGSRTGGLQRLDLGVVRALGSLVVGRKSQRPSRPSGRSVFGTARLSDDFHTYTLVVGKYGVNVLHSNHGFSTQIRDNFELDSSSPGECPSVVMG